VRRRATACYVALETPGARIAGYYTLAAAVVPLADMPAPLAKRLPRYPSVPVAPTRASGDRSSVSWTQARKRLAVGCGGAVPAFGNRPSSPLVVDAKDEQAEAFYLHHGLCLSVARRDSLFCRSRN